MMNYQIYILKLLSFYLIFLAVLGCNSKTEKSLEKVQTKTLEVEQLKPPHWWVGFESKELQLLYCGLLLKRLCFLKLYI